MADPSIGVTGTIEDYVKIIKKVPGVTDEEAKKAAIAWEKQLKKGQIKAALQAQKSAKDAGKAWTDSAKQAGAAAAKASKSAADAAKKSSIATRAGFESLKQAAEAFGGEVGAAAGVVEKLGRSVIEATKAIGPLGTAVGGFAIAVAAVGLAAVGTAKAVFAIVDAAEAARDRLKEIEGTKPLPPESIKALDDWKEAALGLEASSARLKVVVGAELAKAFKDMVPILATAAETATTVAIAAGKAKEALGFLTSTARGLGAIVTLGGTELVRYKLGLGQVGDAARDAAKGLAEASEAAKQNEAAIKAAKDAMDDWVDLGPSFQGFLKAQAELERDAARAAAETARVRKSTISEFLAGLREAEGLIKANEAATASLNAITKSADADQLRGALKIQAAFEDRLVAIEKAEGESSDFAAAQAARDAAEARRARELIALEKEKTEAARASAKERAALVVAASAASRAASEEEKQRFTDNLTTGLDAAQQLTTSLIGLAQQLAANQIAAQAKVAQAALDDIAKLKGARDEVQAEQQRLNEALLTDQERAAAGAAQLRDDESGASQQAIDDTKAELAADIDARKARLKQARQAARDLAKGAKQLARLEIVVNAASAGIKAFATSGPVLGGIAAAAIAATAATQLAAVNARPLPTFHIGGIVGATAAIPPAQRTRARAPDERDITVLDEEAVLNQRGTAALGEDGVNQLNRTGSMGSTTIVQMLDGRVIQRVIQRGQAQGTIMGDRHGPVGQQNVFEG